MAKEKSSQQVDAISEREGTIMVSSTVLGKEKQERKRIPVRPFVTHPATVSVKYGQTLPTVQYGSVRVDVMITCPCYKEEILDVYEMVRGEVDRLMDIEAERFGSLRDDKG